MPDQDRRALAASQLARLERDVLRMDVALARVERGAPIPPDVLALVTAPVAVVSVADLAPLERIRFLRALARVEAMTRELLARRREVVARLAAVRATQRIGPSAVRVDELT